MSETMRICLLILFFASPLCADDWPTHQHDNQRTGQSNETLTMPLHLQWSHRLPRPEPAWPLPAKQDYWHRKTNLQPRIVHDRAHGIVAADGRAFVSSATDDQLRAFDIETGEQLWSAFAEGPIRLAPTVWKDLVLFAADDGCVYGVDTSTGKRQWKTRPSEIGPRRIPGNGRIISERPIRSGVMVKDDGTGYFAAGIFPLQGAFFFSIDARSGKIIDQAKIEKSIQGYLEQQAGQVFAPTGRDPKGFAVKGKASPTKLRKTTPTKGSYCVVRDAQHTFLGRDNKVVATNGDEDVWKAKVSGRVYDMAVADGRLFVSTDQGMLYAFGSGQRTEPSTHTQAMVKPSTIPDEWLRPGYVLYVDPDNSSIKEIISRGKHAASQTIVAVKSQTRANALRQRFNEDGVYGRVVVHEVDPSDLPYGDNLFHKVYGENSESFVRHAMPQRARELAPGRSWTHAYGGAGNKASSNAKVGAKSMLLQWFGGPGPRNMVDRHMRTMPPLAHHGIMYVPGLDRVIAVDSFTGTILWERKIPKSTRIGMLKDCGWMVACDDGLLVAVEDELLQITTERNGTSNQKTLFTLPGGNRHWGYLASVGDLILGSMTIPGSHRKTINREAILEGAYSDYRPIVCSDRLFGLKSDTGKLQEAWTYKSSGAILNPTIAANKNSVMFIESQSVDIAEAKGRIRLVDFLKQDAKLVSIDLQTGKKQWNVDLPETHGAQNAFVLCDNEHTALVCSRNDKTVFYDVRVYSSIDGNELWTSTQDNKKRPGGDHGEQDKHPVLIGNKLIVEPYGYDLDTGSKLTEIDLSKRGYGCGTLSGSAEALFFRSGNPASYSLKSNKINPVNSVTRPSCWINMVPAEGLLLIPEGSSGCVCNFPIQTSMAFVPAERD